MSSLNWGVWRYPLSINTLPLKSALPAAFNSNIVLSVVPSVCLNWTTPYALSASFEAINSNIVLLLYPQSTYVPVADPELIFIVESSILTLPENSELPLTVKFDVNGLTVKLPLLIATFSVLSIIRPILLWVDDWPNPNESSNPLYDNLAPLLPLSTNTIFDVPVAVANLATTLLVFVPCISNDPVILNLDVVVASTAPNCNPTWPFNVLSPANVGT